MAVASSARRCRPRWSPSSRCSRSGPAVDVRARDHAISANVSSTGPPPLQLRHNHRLLLLGSIETILAKLALRPPTCLCPGPLRPFVHRLATDVTAAPTVATAATASTVHILFALHCFQKRTVRGHEANEKTQWNRAKLDQRTMDKGSSISFPGRSRWCAHQAC